MDGSGDVSSHPAVAQPDHSTAANSTSIAGGSHELCFFHCVLEAKWI